MGFFERREARKIAERKEDVIAAGRFLVINAKCKFVATTLKGTLTRKIKKLAEDTEVLAANPGLLSEYESMQEIVEKVMNSFIYLDKEETAARFLGIETEEICEPADDEEYEDENNDVQE